MRPNVLNRICAHPIIVSWFVGAWALNAVVLTLGLRGVRLAGFGLNLKEAAVLPLVVIATTGLGFFLGMFTCWPWIRAICGRFNGAPLKPGDHVFILSGPHRGTTRRVYEITTGQGGWNLARLDLGAGCKEKFSDIFEEYSVLKIQGEPLSLADAVRG